MGLEELKAAVLEDGVIDAEEVVKIKEAIYEDGIIDREEADLLFELNNATSGKDNAPEWKDLFVEALCDHVLKDEVSPGEIDEAEAKWLIERVKGDGVYDANEMALFTAIKEEASKVHESLTFQFDLMGA